MYCDFAKILSSLNFEDPSSCTFHFTYDMLTDTLFDIDDLTILKPTNRIWTPTFEYEVDYKLDMSSTSYNKFIQNN